MQNKISAKTIERLKQQEREIKRMVCMRVATSEEQGATAADVSRSLGLTIERAGDILAELGKAQFIARAKAQREGLPVWHLAPSGAKALRLQGPLCEVFHA